MITRRRLLVQGTARALLAAPLAALLTACARDAGDGGPAPLQLGRDLCTRCAMILSDARFAAEVRGGPGDALYKFDDIGCAVSWLEAQSWGADPVVRIWVAAADSRGADIRWLDARRAHYLPGHSSPMGYNYAAAAVAASGSVDFVTMRRAAATRGY